MGNLPAEQKTELRFGSLQLIEEHKLLNTAPDIELASWMFTGEGREGGWKELRGGEEGHLSYWLLFTGCRCWISGASVCLSLCSSSLDSGCSKRALHLYCLGASQMPTLSGPTPDPLNQNLHFNKIRMPLNTSTLTASSMCLLLTSKHAYATLLPSGTSDSHL